MHEILKIAGLESRVLQFYGEAKYGHYSHIAIEVKIGGSWSYLDPTWNAFFVRNQRLGSVSEIMDDGIQHFNPHEDLTDYRYILNRDQYDVWAHLKKGTSVIFGQDEGKIFISANRLSDAQINLSHIPNYIGDNQDDGAFEGIKYAFENPALKSMSISVSGVGGCSKDDKICLNDDCRLVHSYPYKFQNVSQNATLEIRAKSSICYSVFQDINYKVKK